MRFPIKWVSTEKMSLLFQEAPQGKMIYCIYYMQLSPISWDSNSPKKRHFQNFKKFLDGYQNPLEAWT